MIDRRFKQTEFISDFSESELVSSALLKEVLWKDADSWFYSLHPDLYKRSGCDAYA